MFMAKMPWEEIGSWDVKAKKATLLGDGEGKIAFTAMIEYFLLFPNPIFS